MNGIRGLVDDAHGTATDLSNDTVGPMFTARLLDT
jgi:hypothetical protein